MHRHGPPELLSRSDLFARLSTSIELEPKRPPKGGECSFGGVGLGCLQGGVMPLARVFAAGFTRAMSLPDDGRPVRLNREPDLGRVHSREVAAVLAREHAFGFERLPAPAVKAEDAVRS